jgi:hypothetical protein
VAKNPDSLPGTELLQDGTGKNRSAADKIFVTPDPKQGAGGGGRKPRPAAAPGSEPDPFESMEPPEPMPAAPPAAKSTVEVYDLAWSEESVGVGEKITVYACADLPEDKKHLTRLTFTLFAICDGKPKRMDGKDSHLADGEASAEFTIDVPHHSGPGAPPAEYEYRFTAKHRDSQEEKSPPLTATLEFDEQIQFLNDEGQEPLADLPYYIECKGKKIASGRTDGNGMCPRISTQTRSESLAYFTGDEALAKEDF